MAAARAWWCDERSTVIALWAMAADLGLAEHATDLARILWQSVDGWKSMGLFNLVHAGPTSPT